MASKKIAKVVKLQIPAGDAKPGAALASAGILMPKFCSEFNEKTASRRGEIVPVIITAYEDKSFDFELKITPVVELIKKECNLQKGSGVPNKEKVAKLNKEQVKKIAEIKMADFNTVDLESAMKIVEGTARSMGVEVE